MYAVLRHEVQKQISAIYGWDSNNWTNRKRKYIDFTVPGEGSTNYPDWRYEHFSGNLSTPGHATDSYNTTDRIVIGAKPICIVCGERHSRSNSLSCGNHRYIY